MAKELGRTVLLTLGRLPVSLHLARAMRAQGWRVIVAEPFRYHLCQLSNAVDKSFTVVAPSIDTDAYLSDLKKIIDDEQVSLVLPVSEEALFVAALKPCLADGVKLMCLNQQALLQLHDKYTFAQLAERIGVAVPETAIAKDASVMPGNANTELVVKPRLSCSGKGVRFIDGLSSLTSSEISEKYIVQKKLDGPVCCSFSIAHEGVCLQTLCYKSLLTSGSVAVCFEEIAVPKSIERSIEKLVQATDYSGMISFDFMRDKAGQWCAIECNPRATSGLHFLEFRDVYHTLINHRAITSRTFSGRFQEFWSCLTTLEAQLLKGTVNRSGWKNLFTTRDINWKRSDIKPFFLMSLVMAPLLFKALKSGKPLTELLMDDVSWHDG